jgi:hypothetical protein
MKMLQIVYSNVRDCWLVGVNEGVHFYPLSHAKRTQAEAEELAKQWAADLQNGLVPPYEVMQPKDRP